jgi:hypothetical protein
MKAIITATALFGLTLWAAPARADDCSDVIEHVDDVVQVQSKIMQTKMAEVTKAASAANAAGDDKAKEANKKTFCSASGEFLGISRAYRVVASECLRGAKRRDTHASVDKSIKQVEDSMAPNCQ